MLRFKGPLKGIHGLYTECKGLYIYIYMGLCRDKGKESGSYCLGLRV